MTQSPYGPPDGGTDAVPTRSAGWAEEPDTGYQASSGFVASSYDTGSYDTGSSSLGYADEDSSSTTDVAKDEAADLKDTAAERGQQVADTAKEQAAQVKDTAVEQGQQVAGVAKEEAGKVKAEATTQVKDLLAQSRTELGSQAVAQQQRLATIVHGFAGELGGMASASEESGPLTDLVHTASRRGGELAHFLSDSEPSDVLEQVKSFARRRPVAFLGASVLAGIVVGRLTRSAIAEAKPELDAPKHDAVSTGYATATPVYETPVYGTETPGYDTVTPGYGTQQAPVYGAETPAYGAAPGLADPYPDTPVQGGYTR